MRGKLTVALLATTLAGTLAGCGETVTTTVTATVTAPAQARLNEDQTVRVAEIDVAIARYCVKGVEATGPQIRAVIRGVDELIAMFRNDPDALYAVRGDAVTMREHLADKASQLEACDTPTAAKQIDRALAARP